MQEVPVQVGGPELAALHVDGSVQRIRIQVPATKRYGFLLPAGLADSRRQSVVQLNWQDDRIQVESGLKELDLTHNMCMRLFRSKPEPKLIIVRAKGNAAAELDGDVAFPVGRQFMGKVHVYTADAKATRAMWAGEFGLTRTDLPAVLLWDNKNEKGQRLRFVMKEPITKDNAIEFVGEYLQHGGDSPKLHPAAAGKRRRSRKGKRKRRREL